MIQEDSLNRMMKVEIKLSLEIRATLIALLLEYVEVFAWGHGNILGIDPDLISHTLT